MIVENGNFACIGFCSILWCFCCSSLLSSYSFTSFTQNRYTFETIKKKYHFVFNSIVACVTSNVRRRIHVSCHEKTKKNDLKMKKVYFFFYTKFKHAKSQKSERKNVFILFVCRTCVYVFVFLFYRGDKILVPTATGTVTAVFTAVVPMFVNALSVPPVISVATPAALAVALVTDLTGAPNTL